MVLRRLLQHFGRSPARGPYGEGSLLLVGLSFQRDLGCTQEQSLSGRGAWCTRAAGHVPSRGRSPTQRWPGPSASSLGDQVILTALKRTKPRSPCLSGTWPLPSARHALKCQPFIYTPACYTSTQRNPFKASRPRKRRAAKHHRRFAVSSLNRDFGNTSARNYLISKPNPRFPNASHNESVNICPMTERTGM